MPQQCVVFVPGRRGGYHCYELTASSSFDAASKAIQDHERIHRLTLPDETILQVVIDGKNALIAGYKEHNAAQPNFRVLVGKVRQ